MSRCRAAVIALLALAMPLGQGLAAPGDILFDDDFESAGVGCGTLGQWITTSTALSGVNTDTASAPGGCSMYVNGDAVSVTAPVRDLSGVAGARIVAWVREGEDSFSEDPDAANEDLLLEGLTSTNTWVTLRVFDAQRAANGLIDVVDLSLPPLMLHSGFRFRFRMAGGSGAAWDFWHVDDVELIETGAPPPGSILTANGCDDFEAGFANWTTSVSGSGGISAQTANSGSSSMFTRHTTVANTSIAIDAPNVAQMSAWIRRGSDTFSENPDANENLVVSYLNDVGAWTVLETFPGSGTAGQIFTRTWTLPADARHAGFRMRFEQTSGSGTNFDFWHVDDVCLVSAFPTIEPEKTVEIEQDPVNGTTDAMSIPGAWARYSITVENTGNGSVDSDSMVIRDSIDANTTLFTGDLNGSGSPIIFTDGAGADASGLTLAFASLADAGDGVTFLNAAGTPITPTGGFDPAVRAIALNFGGSFNAATGGATPEFTITYRVRLD